MKKLLVGLCAIFVGASYADTETINWIVDDSTYTTTTCQTGDYITFPTQPTKRGHNFVGWQVALYDFSTLDPSVDGTSYKQSALNRTWSTVFPYGIVSGKSLCSTTGGSYAHTGTPDTSDTGETQWCCCKADGYIPSGSNIVHENILASAWVFYGDIGSGSDCASDCAAYCGNSVRANFSFRRAVFGITQ